MIPLPLFAALAGVLPGTQPLEPRADFSSEMVAGIDRFLLRQTAAMAEHRESFWKRDVSSPEAYRASVAPNRERLRRLLGAVDARVSAPQLERIADTDQPAILAENASATVQRVRWSVFDGVRGEGLLVQPKGKVRARVICLPDADVTPEQWLGLSEGRLDGDWGRDGTQVLIPELIRRDVEFSGSAALNRWTRCSHREWIYRQTFILGRHVIGYEVQKIQALLDWASAQSDSVPVALAGTGEGGLLALYAAALDERVQAVSVEGYFGPREGLWQEPLERNVAGLLREFGDAEIATLIAPRSLVIHATSYPKTDESRFIDAQGRRAQAAPGQLPEPAQAAVRAEVDRAKKLVGGALGDWVQFSDRRLEVGQLAAQLLSLDQIASQPSSGAKEGKVLVSSEDLAVLVRERQRRQVAELEGASQRLLEAVENTRNQAFWQPLPLASLAQFEKHTEGERARFWNDVIGRLPDPNVPAQPRSRLVRDAGSVTIHEVVLNVWDDVFAWGWLGLPKDLKPGEKRPVVVCQHGLEGLPEHCFETDASTRAWAAYKAFALRLAEQGYIVFAPHNPYRGGDAFRTLQRKLQPLGLSLFSVINGQHQRLLEWLKQQPFVQSDKIAFYGLSYGGKSAMRIPAALTDYCLSICSGDFNEWVRKCASTRLLASYVFTGEYEIWEWDLGHTFNYAEMAALIAPRPFMVERGHNDGVGIDEWVNYEFAKVRRLYNKLGIADRTEIEHFDGPHTIHGVGTFDFLRRHLGPAR